MGGPDSISAKALSLLGIPPLTFIKAENRQDAIIAALRKKYEGPLKTGSLSWEEAIQLVANQEDREEIRLLYQAKSNANLVSPDYTSYQARVKKLAAQSQIPTQEEIISVRRSVSSGQLKKLLESPDSQLSSDWRRDVEGLFNELPEDDKASYRERLRGVYQGLMDRELQALAAGKIKPSACLNALQALREEARGFGVYDDSLKGQFDQEINRLNDQALMQELRTILDSHRAIEVKISLCAGCIAKISAVNDKQAATRLAEKAIDDYRDNSEPRLNPDLDSDVEEADHNLKEACRLRLIEDRENAYKTDYDTQRKSIVDKYKPEIQQYQSNARWWQSGLVSYIPFLAASRARTWLGKAAEVETKRDQELKTNGLDSYHGFLEKKHPEVLHYRPSEEKINRMREAALACEDRALIPVQILPHLDAYRSKVQLRDSKQQSYQEQKMRVDAKCRQLSETLASAPSPSKTQPPAEPTQFKINL